MPKKEQIIEDILKQYNAHKYVRIGSDVSVTELMMSPRLVHLRDRYRQNIVEDSLDALLPAIIGTATHDALQRYLRRASDASGKYLIERRLLSVVNGLRIAGRFDILANHTEILDIKVTRVWKYIFGGKDEWEEQLNCYRWMLHQDGFVAVKKLRVMMVLLDWSKFKTYKDSDYPPNRINFIDVNTWSLKTTKDWIGDKIDAFKNSQAVADDQLPLCSASQRWASKPVFKLFRTKTQKSATKNFDSLSRATAYELKCKQNDSKKWDQSYIKTFRGDLWKRCESYCAVAPFCNQYQKRITK